MHIYKLDITFAAKIMDYNEITLKIDGKNGNERLTPANFDISQISVLFEDIEAILYPDRKKRKERPVISYELRDGCVSNIFRTSMQGVLMLSAMIGTIEMNNGSIDELEANSASAIEHLQAFAIENDYNIEIATSDKPNRKFTISPSTRYKRNDNVMVETETYYYGTLVDAGGKDKANIHLDTAKAGVLTIRVEKEILAQYEANPLYRKFGVRVRAKQNMKTGDIDKGSLSLVELIDYQRGFNENYLNGLIRKATPKWRGVNANEWLSTVRGGLA